MTNTNKTDEALKMMESVIRHRDKGYYAVAATEDVSRNEAAIISFLCANDDKDIYQRDLEREFNQRRSTISGIVKEMEAKGLIIRTSVVADARLKKVVPTDKARSVNEYVRKNTSDFAEKAIKLLDDSEIDAFYDIVQKIKTCTD